MSKAAMSSFALPNELVAKVLGYLPLRDRFRLETVCKQWQRCMYLEVEHLYLRFFHKVAQKYTLTISDVYSHCQLITCSCKKKLPTVLQKLRSSKVGYLSCVIEGNISDRRLFALLADIASPATEVVVQYYIGYGPSNLVAFCDIIGPHITSFQLTSCEQQRLLPEDIQAFAYSLARMKRLKTVSSGWSNLIFTCLNSFPTKSLPHLQEIQPWFREECDWRLWEHFKSLYGSQLKKIKLHNSRLLDDQGDVLLPWKDMAPFANLKHLDFMFRLDDCTLTALAEDLEAISRSCPLLESLGFKREDLLSEHFIVSLMEVRKLFVAIGKMKMLEKLDLKLGFPLEDLGDISSRENFSLFALLENKSNITHLKANVRLFQISSENKRTTLEIYGTLNKAMPNLRHLNIFCLVSELDHFVGLERMQTVTLYHFYSEKDSWKRVHSDSLIHILKSSPALRNIQFYLQSAEASEALIRAIIDVAKLQMEKHIDVIAKIGVVNKTPEAWEATKHLAPINLTLTFEDQYC